MPAQQPHQQPHHDMVELQRDLSQALDQRMAQEAASRPSRPQVVRPATGIRPPDQSDAAPAPEMWGLHTPRAPGPPAPSFSGSPQTHVTSPLELLTEVADNTERLQMGLESLLTELTGEEPPVRRLKSVPAKRAGLLPAIVMVATDIEQSHRDLDRLITHIRGRLA